MREQDRNADFRMAVSHGLDRQRLGDSLVKGPFTTVHPCGLYAGTSFHDAASTVYYPFSVKTAKAHLEKAGLVDTDGNGFVTYPDGEDVSVVLLHQVDYSTDANLAEGMVAMMADIGLQVTLNSLPAKDYDTARDTGKYDWAIYRNQTELITAAQNTSFLASVGPTSSRSHMANGAGALDLMPFEEEMVKVVNACISSRGSAEQFDLMNQYQELYTENIYAVGLTAYPGALIINNRFSNIPAGAPIYMYNGAEDSITAKVSGWLLTSRSGPNCTPTPCPVRLVMQARWPSTKGFLPPRWVQ